MKPGVVAGTAAGSVEPVAVEEAGEEAAKASPRRARRAADWYIKATRNLPPPATEKDAGGSDDAGDRKSVV